MKKKNNNYKDFYKSKNFNGYSSNKNSKIVLITINGKKLYESRFEFFKCLSVSFLLQSALSASKLSQNGVKLPSVAQDWKGYPTVPFVQNSFLIPLFRF